MSAKVWIDGTFFDKYDAKISVYDHGLLFGDGVRAETRIYNGAAFRLADHLRWMFTTADAIALPIPLSEAEFTAAVAATIAANRRTEGYVRITVTRGAGTLGIDPRKCTPCVVIVAEDVMPVPREVSASGIDVITATVRRGELPPNILGRAAEVVAKGGAFRRGCFEALMLDPRDEVTGPTDGNLILVEGDCLFTPAACGDPVMRETIRELAAGVGLGFDEARPVTSDRVKSASEVIFASWAAEIVAVRSIDSQPIGDGVEGPVAKRLREAFRRATRAEGGSPIMRGDEPPASHAD